MSTATLTEYQQYLIEWAAKDAKSKTQTWPGFPLSQLPLAAKGDLHALIDAGLLQYVHVTKTNAPTGGGQRKLTYVAPKNA